MKNIIVCCDGTNNQFSGYHTNVIRTYKIARYSESQVASYDPGVGTMPEPWNRSRVSQFFSIVGGLAFGSGFRDNVAVGYRYLMHTYEAGDRVFLFGFSRGAFTARALAGMLHSVGLLRSGSENLIRYAMKYWENDWGPDSAGGKLCAEFKTTLARDCPVHFIGVWDTVSSVGLVNHFATFPFTRHNPSVTHVRHAVSIDERRCMFRQNLMEPVSDVQDVRNVWFAGVHSDVGGGYNPIQAGLAKVAFEWLIIEAQKCGMEVDQAAFTRELNAPEGPNPLGQAHNSLTLLWWFAEFLPVKRYSFKDGQYHWSLSLGRRREVHDATRNLPALVHQSVVERMEKMPEYHPTNLARSVQQLRSRYRIEPRIEPAPANV